MLFSDMVEPVLFMYELFATVMAADNRMVMHFPGVFYQVIIIFKLGIALVA